MHRPARRLLSRGVRALTAGALLATAAVALPAPASAAVTGAMISDAGCATTTLATSDDGFSGLEALPFPMALYGQTYSGLYVATDGGVGFTQGDARISPYGGTTGGPVVAPLSHYSLSTRFGGQVTYGAVSFEGHQAFCVNWVDVEYDTMGYNGNPVSAQLLVVQREDVAPDAVDLVLNYGSVLSDPGLVAGVSDDTGSDYYLLPGSGQGGFSDGSPTALVSGSTAGQVPGRYVIPVRGGRPVPPGGQVISLTTPPSLAAGGPGFDLQASSSSGLPVDVQVTSGPCTVSGGLLFGTGTGTCYLYAQQAGGGGFTAAQPVFRTVEITATPVALTLGDLQATYDGFPHPVTVTSVPDLGYPVQVTYGGSTTPPTVPGAYPVQASVTAPGASGYTSGTLVIDKAVRTGDLLVQQSMSTDGTYLFQTTGDVTGAVFTNNAEVCTVNGAQLVLAPLHVGTCVLTMTLPETATHLQTVRTRSITITPGAASIGLYGLAQTYDGTPRPVYVSTYPSGLTGVQLSYEGSPQAPTLPGTYTVTVSLDNPDFTFTPYTATMVIGKRAQDVFFNPPPSVPFGSFVGLYGYATSGLPVTYAVSGPCHQDAGRLVLDHAGTCAVVASQVGDAVTLPAASVTRFVEVTRLAQTVTLSDPPATVVFGSNGPFTPFASASSGLPVTITASGSCRYDGALVQLDHAGDCTLVASQPGDADTEPAVPVVTTFTVARGTQQLSMQAPPSLRSGTSAAVYGLSFQGLPVTVSVTGPCTVVGDVVTGAGVGACTVTLDQAGDADYLPASTSAVVDVLAPASQTVTLDPVPDVRWGEHAAAPVATADSSLPVALSTTGPCAVVDGLLTYTGLGLCTVTAEQSGGAGWAAATPVSQSFSILPGSAQVALFDLQQTEGAVHAPGVVTTPAGLATVLTYDGSTVLPTAPGRYLVRATVDDPHYEPAFLETALDVAAVTPTAASPSPSTVVPASPSPTAPVAPASPSPSAAASVAPSPVAPSAPVPSSSPSPLASPALALPSLRPSPAVSAVAVLPSVAAPVPPAASPGAAASPSPEPSPEPSSSPSDDPTATPDATATPGPEATPTAGPAAGLEDPVLDPASGERPAPPVGESVSTLDGRPDEVRVEVVDTVVMVEAGDVALSVAALGADGAVHRPGEDATLRLDRGGNLHLVATGYQPGTEVVAWVFSDPVRLGSASAGTDGSVDAVFPVPGALPGGEHTLQVNGASAEGVRSISLGLLIDPSGVPLWQLADHPEVVVATQVTFFALAGVAALGGIGAIGTSLGAAGAASGTPGAAGAAAGATTEDKPRKSGKVAAAKVKHLDVLTAAAALGDRSPTWRLPGSSRLDDWSVRWPAKVGPLSPMLARLMTDGAYLRAMLGALSPLVTVVAVALAVLAGTGTGALAVPAAGLVGAVLVLGVVDALAGSAAAVAFLTTLLLRGQLDTADAVRGSLGVAAMWFALPLLLGETRPLRRAAARSVAAAWYRLGDVVVLPLLAAWLTLKLVSAFAGLYGHAVDLSASAKPLALVAGGAVLLRLLVEEVAARLYPRRLTEVTASAIPSPGTAQKLSAVGLRTGLFLFVAAPFVGVRPELFVGAALFVLPQVVKVWDSRLPNLPWLHKWLPSGLVKLTGLVVVGWWLSSQLKQRVDDPRDLASLGFVVLALPPFVQGLLGLVGRSSPKPQPSWLRRSLGAAVVAASISLVYSLTVA